MTPAEVLELDDETYQAFVAFQNEDLKAREKAAKRKR